MTRFPSAPLQRYGQTSQPPYFGVLTQPAARRVDDGLYNVGWDAFYVLESICLTYDIPFDLDAVCLTVYD